jgi:anti-sigma B factor antagonist
MAADPGPSGDSILTIEVADLADIFGAPGIALAGERLDTLRRKISTAIAGGRRNILLDLEAASLIDSEGIGALVLYKKLAMDAGGDLKLLRPRGRIAELIEVVKLDSIFEIYEDAAAARASFARGAG